MFGIYRNAKEAAEAQVQQAFAARQAVSPPVRMAEVAVMERPVANAKPQPIRPEVMVPADPSEGEQEYERLAAELGYQPKHIYQRRAKKEQALRRKEVIEFLLDKGIPLYSNDEVQAYMDRLVDEINSKNGLKRDRSLGDWPLGIYWRWVALRKQDVAHCGRLSDGGITYRHLVPMEMLKRVKTIVEKFGEAATFAVTDYYSPSPDPFIAFRLSDHGDIYIFGVWDEPGFGLDK